MIKLFTSSQSYHLTALPSGTMNTSYFRVRPRPLTFNTFFALAQSLLLYPTTPLWILQAHCGGLFIDVHLKVNQTLGHTFQHSALLVPQGWFLINLHVSVAIFVFYSFPVLTFFNTQWMSLTLRICLKSWGLHSFKIFKWSVQTKTKFLNATWR